MWVDLFGGRHTGLITAVVEIDGTTGVIVLAVFVIVFLVIAALGWVIVRQLTADTSVPGKWRFSANIPLPVSKATFDQLAAAATKATTRPSLTPEQRRFVSGLSSTRKTLARGYRLGLVVGGVLGIALSILIYRDSKDEEMILLPVGIIFLVGLGVLLSGLIPSRTVDPIEPIAPELLRNIRVNVDTRPLTIQFDAATTDHAVALLRRGIGPESVARAVIPDYDSLSEGEKQQVQQALTELRARF